MGRRVLFINATLPKALGFALPAIKMAPKMSKNQMRRLKKKEQKKAQVGPRIFPIYLRILTDIFKG